MPDNTFDPNTPAGSRPLMPALFIGHGSPMNALEDNDFSRVWSR